MIEKHTNLIDYVKQGNVVLFLGAGASLAAKDDNGNSPPLAKPLATLISDRFLNGELKSASLAQIAECAISATNTSAVQEFVKEVFEPFRPGKAHKLLPKFSWAGLVSTNYDLLVEEAYSNAAGSPQELNPYVYDHQNVTISDSGSRLNYLKIHGCFAHMAPNMVPLVLSLDQYLDFEKGRKSLFDTFEEWARKYTFVFVGYGAEDLNVRRYITRLVDNVEDRMRFYFVRPGWAEVEKQMWETRKVTAIDMDFDSFLSELDQIVGDEFRGMRVERKIPPALRARLLSDKYALGKNTSEFLDGDAQFVEDIDVGPDGNQLEFFRGNSSGWECMSYSWDFGRDVVEAIFIERILDDSLMAEVEPALILLKGYAGAGKTVALKRIAWDIVREHKGIAIYIDRPEDLNSGALAEIVELTQSRIFVIIDDVGKGYTAFRNCLKGLGAASKMITFIGGARTNDWNLVRSQFGFIQIYEYSVGDLGYSEIVRLLQKLELFNCLGELEKLTPEQRIDAFRETADKNLLVALYETTRGKSLEEIVIDEYETLCSDEAQSVYLTICTLNRLKVPVRATLISRLHKLPYKDFKDRLFEPLEGVVYNRYDKHLGDYVYFARHPYIAEIVFKIILSDQSRRFEEYHNVVNSLNMAYSSDALAFKEMLRGRVLADMFSDPKYVEQIYKVAESKYPNDAHLYHQRGVFEMSRAGGDLDLAQEYIDAASELMPRNNLIKHSAAELLLKRALAAKSVLQERLLRKAERLCESLAATSKSSHARHTLAKISLARAENYVKFNGSAAMVGTLRELVKKAQREVDGSLQMYPGDSYLLDSRARFSRLIGEQAAVIGSLEEAFKNNPHLGYIAIQLHVCYLEAGELEKAGDVLKTCITQNRNDRSVNFTYGKFLMDHNMDAAESIVYLKRSFVPGDQNFDAQLRYGRQCFTVGEYTECERHFGTVRATRFPPRLGSETFYPETLSKFGSVQEIHAQYLLVRDNQSGLTIRVYRENAEEDLFRNVKFGSRLTYRVAVNVFGLRAVDAQLADKGEPEALLFG